MRRHPILAILTASAASLGLHQAVGAPSCGAPAQTLAVQLHDDDTSTHYLPDTAHRVQSYTLALTFPDIGHGADVLTEPSGALELRVLDQRGRTLSYERALDPGRCQLDTLDTLERATWLSLRHDRDADFTHTCDATLSISVPSRTAAKVVATWRTDTPHATPPVLVLTPR
jgi:hypothetical protein